ncbi:MAG: molybdenum cofactor guanylyltransferase [Thermoproteota archaeon]
MSNLSAAILALKDKSSLFQGMKYLSPLFGKPLISRVVDVALSIANETLTVVPCEDDKALLRDLITTMPGESISVVVDRIGEGSDLTMAETAFMSSSCSRTILLPGDAPFLNIDVLSMMADLCRSRDAVIPRTPDGEMVPIPAVYATEVAARAARDSRLENASDISRIIEKLNHKMFLSSSILAEFDRDLLMLFTINSPLDLKRAEMIVSGNLKKSKKRKGYDH